MSESPRSNLRSFTVNDLDELNDALYEVTGLDDEQIAELIHNIPIGHGYLSAINHCAPGGAKAKSHLIYLECTYMDGQYFFLIQGNGDKKCTVYLQEPATPPAGATDDIDSGWD